MKAVIVLLLASAPIAYAAVTAADSARGAALFESLGCVQCHSVNQKGGHAGPDLGRLVDRNFTPAVLAATMWNHAPAMWASMNARSIPAGKLDEQAAADLFAYFYSARFFEHPGDAARGKRAFTARQCSLCHGIDKAVQVGIPPVIEWHSLNSPFALAAAMWNHFPRMEAAAAERRIVLPRLSAQDLTDLLVWLRNLPTRRQEPATFQTTSGANGQALFESKGCAKCHHTAPALGARIKGSSLTEIAAAMWNHAPGMISAGAHPAQFQPGEMRDLLSYLWARQFFEDAGDAAHGRRVFASKQCVGCHSGASPAGPNFETAGRSITAAGMVSALWRHGPTMLQQMQTRGVRWPRFEAREMSDLIAYLNSKAGSQ